MIRSLSKSTFVVKNKRIMSDGQFHRANIFHYINRGKFHYININFR